MTDYSSSGYSSTGTTKQEEVVEAQLILKWGGVLTQRGRREAEQLGVWGREYLYVFVLFALFARLPLVLVLVGPKKERCVHSCFLIFDIDNFFFFIFMFFSFFFFFF